MEVKKGKNRTSEEKAHIELLQMSNIVIMEDIQNLFKEIIAEFMENGQEAELSYNKYDYKK